MKSKVSLFTVTSSLFRYPTYHLK